jgi:hypothetical protein
MKYFILILSVITLLSCGRTKEITKDIPVVYAPDEITDTTYDYQNIPSTPECEDLIKAAIDSITNYYRNGQNAAGDKLKLRLVAQLQATKDSLTGERQIYLRYKRLMEAIVQPKPDSTSIAVKVKEVSENTWFENFQLKTWWGLLLLVLILGGGIYIIIRKRA